MTDTAEAEKQILAELNKIGRVLALMATRDLNQPEKIALLASAGLQPREIAELIGTTRNTVSVTLSNMRRRQPRTRKRKEEAEA